MASIRELYRADYTAHCSHKPPEPDRFRRLIAVARLIVNPSLQVVLALRLANASPRWSWWAWRSFFLRMHSMDWSGPVQIGPGLQIPHPIGICLAPGSRIGADAGLGHNVTLAEDEGSGPAVLGDRVTMFPGSLVAGGARVGDDCIVGANCVVTEDVAPSRLVTLRGVLPRAASRRTPTME